MVGKPWPRQSGSRAHVCSPCAIYMSMGTGEPGRRGCAVLLRVIQERPLRISEEIPTLDQRGGGHGWGQRNHTPSPNQSSRSRIEFSVASP